MAGRVESKTAFVTGAARGQGRSHCVRLAEEGADIIAVDSCSDVASVSYPMASSDDLDETVRQVEALGRRIVAVEADVRDRVALKAAVDEGVERLGRLDIVCANAGIFSFGRLEEITEQAWHDVIDVNLTGVWHTATVSIPHLRAAGGGSIIITSSNAGLRAFENAGHYVMTKHGLVGLMRTLALELAADKIRVNTIHPSSTATTMLLNDGTYELFAADLPVDERTEDVIKERMQALNLLEPVPWLDPRDISNGVLWLASDEARYVTGATLPVDAGSSIK